MKIGEILLANGKISAPQLQHALNISGKSSERLGEILYKWHFVTEEDLLSALSIQTGVAIWGEPITQVATKYLEDITPSLAVSYGVLPVVNGGELPSVLIHDPTSKRTISFLHQHHLSEAPRFLAPASFLQKTIEEFVPVADRIADLNKIIEKIAKEGISGGELIKLLNALLSEAMVLGASDVHLEPTFATSDIRFRIDGILVPIVSLPFTHHGNFCNAIYAMASITPGEFSKPHDSSFTHIYHGRPVEIRLSSLPVKHGDTSAAALVLRILDKHKTVLPLQFLGYQERERNKISKMVKIPQGLILLTGPTGSGKTTALYAVLASIRSEETKILTVEDPVEINLPGVQQVEVNTKSGLTFATTLRSFLRHDPDIILVGEIRDQETALEAIRAAQTGHKTFSTLHTTDTVSAITRLSDLGVSMPYLGMALTGIISQRLVRKLCPLCRQEVSTPAEHQKRIKKGTVFAPGGCTHCTGGYKGRTVVVEILETEGQLKQEMKGGNLNAVTQVCNEMTKGDFITLHASGMELVEKGVTSIEEIERVVG